MPFRIRPDFELLPKETGGTSAGLCATQMNVIQITFHVSGRNPDGTRRANALLAALSRGSWADVDPDPRVELRGVTR
jgi:hypothetical protein